MPVDSDAPAMEAGVLVVPLDLRIYRLSAIKKAAYRVAKTCTAAFEGPKADELTVRFTFPRGTTEADAFEAVRTFHQELLDQELREQVAEETSAIRALILAHAFSKTPLIRHE